MEKRLIALNMAIVMLLCMVQISFAEDTSLSLTSTEPYTISVNGTTFYSNVSKSGTGWSYSNYKLTLKNYNGGSIYSGGDLTIYSEGDTTITGSGSFSVDYGSAGIFINGSLIFCGGGNVEINGGDGYIDGGEGIYAKYVRLSGGSFTISGGNSYTRYAGYGIWATSGVDLLSYSKIIGGFTASGSAGYGICSPQVYIGYVNAHILGGKNESTETYTYAVNGKCKISYDEDNNNIYNNGSHVQSKRKYNVTLNGNGGTYNGENTYTIRDEWGTRFYVRHYIFNRDSYVFAGWQIPDSGDVIPINSNYICNNEIYATDVSLNAYWVKPEADDVVLVGINGMIDGNVYKSYQNKTILPSAIENNSEAKEIFVWTDDAENFNKIVDTDAEADLSYSGKYWSAGDTVSVTSSSPVSLYGFWLNKNYISFIVYHSSRYGVKNGGTTLLQGRRVISTSDLETYTYNAEIADDSKLVVPEYYEFAGWSQDSSSSSVDYTPGQSITIGLGVKDLYAVWKAKTYSKTVNDILFEITPANKTAKITVPKSVSELYPNSKLFVAMYDNGKMIGCNMKSAGSTDISLDLTYSGENIPKFVLYITDSEMQPRCDSTECTWINDDFE